MKTIATLAITLLFCCTATAQGPTAALIPVPNHIEQGKAGHAFNLKRRNTLTSNLPADAFAVKELQRIVKERTGVEIVCTGKGCINMSIDTTLGCTERYTIKVTSKEIRITGATETALLHATRTLDQMLLGDITNSTDGRIACIFIDDKPRYPHRAIMIDPARHFLPVKDVKFFIDLIAKYKYNTLQLHLTDDQGWRVEIKSHPELTAKGAFRNSKGGSNGPDNGYYTQEELKEIVRYATERGIEVIPELDIPGHSVAILAAYPHLGCAFRHSEAKDLNSTTNMMLCACSDEAYSIYNDIFRELADIFPSKHIHLGGDEAAIKENWAKCEDCLALMRANGYSSPAQLMNIFFGRMLDLVRKNGKKPTLWCELDNIYPPANDYLFPYPADVTLVTWRYGLTPKCIELTRKHGHNLIMAPGEHAYLDYPQYRGDLPEHNNWGMPVTTLEQTYSLDPSYGLPQEETAHITGIMGTLWGEAIRDINRVNYMAFPRALALAEAGWSNMSQRSWEGFKARLTPNITDLFRCGAAVRVPFEVYRDCE